MTPVTSLSKAWY